MVSWILNHIGFLVFLFVAISIVRKIRGALKRAEEDASRRDSTPRRIANVDPDEADRVRKIQEEIRRKIAERRGGVAPPIAPTPAAEERPPLLRPEPASSNPTPFDPMGSPLKRVLTELERMSQQRDQEAARAREAAQTRVRAQTEARAQAAAQAEADVQLERQRRLANQLNSMEASRKESLAAEDTTTGAMELDQPPKAAEVARDELLADLRDPQGLRRAFVLREILGAPVGLR
jgi:hypothetical protein